MRFNKGRVLMLSPKSGRDILPISKILSLGRIRIYPSSFLSRTLMDIRCPPSTLRYSFEC
jgi:hypothetical protein